MNLVLPLLVFGAIRRGVAASAADGEMSIELDDGTAIALQPPREAGGYHLFLSHAWRYGQDQCGTLKSMLQVLLPACRCFLDVDSLQDIANLERHVGESDCVLVLLTRGYLSSANCLRELREADEW